MWREFLAFVVGLFKAYFSAKPDALAVQARDAGASGAEVGMLEKGAAVVQAAGVARERADAHGADVLAGGGAAPDSVRPDLSFDDPFQRD